MGLEDDIAFFERVPMLAVLGKQALRVLAIGAETRHLPSGAVLFYAGELADGAYIVQQGSLLIEPGDTHNVEYTVGPGEMLGELALLTDSTSPVTAIAQEPTVLTRISRGLFRKTLEGYPAAAMRLRDEMAGRMSGLADELEGVRKKLQRD